MVANWLLIMKRTKQLTFFTAGYAQVSTIFPFIVASPAYFAGTVQLGGLMQTASAFSSVQTALSFFITAYRQLAEWRAVIARLDGFNAAVEKAQAAATTPAGDRGLGARGQGWRSRSTTSWSGCRRATPLVAADDITVARASACWSPARPAPANRPCSGPSPASGRSAPAPSSCPRGAKVMALPQRPYFPIGTLAAAVTYPAEPGTFGPDELAEVIGAVGLPALAARLDEEAHWNRMLSLGEQQRLGIARALLQAPDYLFLDEATASLDEPSEAALYRLLGERLAGATIVSIGHRSTLAAFHRRGLALVRDGDCLSAARGRALAAE